MALEWKDGGSEPLIWSNDGHHTWCAVWRRPPGYAAWISGPTGSEITNHPTESAARDWCEAQMPRENANA